MRKTLSNLEGTILMCGGPLLQIVQNEIKRVGKKGRNSILEDAEEKR